MLQLMDDNGVEREVFVVDFATLPELPITWSTPAEEPYAKALGAAITTKLITKPGKYAIAVDTSPDDPNVILNYNIYTIVE